MYTSFSIENFRLFDQLTVEPLARVNLIAGQNNAGKTALLEALWLHSGPNLPDLGVRLSGFRGIPGTNPQRLLYDLFYDFDANRVVTLSARGNWNNRPRVLKFASQPRNTEIVATPQTNFPANPPRGSQEPDVSAISSSMITLDYTDERGTNFPSSGWWVRSEGQVVNMGPNVQMALAGEGMSARQAKMPEPPSSVFMAARHRTSLEEDVKRFGDVELDGYAGSIVRCLQVVDERITRLITIAGTPTPMVYADLGLSRPVPMGFLGDGVGRLLSMALAFHQARNGTILVDEIENGLHHSKLLDVWKNLDWLSREFNVQVFATTHSDECIVAANSAFTELESKELNLHQLYRQGDRVKVQTYNKDAIETNVEYGWELR